MIFTVLLTVFVVSDERVSIVCEWRLRRSSRKKIGTNFII
jgi:hypothetical protein